MLGTTGEAHTNTLEKKKNAMNMSMQIGRLQLVKTLGFHKSTWSSNLVLFSSEGTRYIYIIKKKCIIKSGLKIEIKHTIIATVKKVKIFEIIRK